MESFKQYIKPFDDCCPICFNDFDIKNKINILSCPNCKNYVHIECAEIWLEKRKTVYCVDQNVGVIIKISKFNNFFIIISHMF